VYVALVFILHRAKDITLFLLKVSVFPCAKRTPQARFLNFLGFKLPFDRHDWVVDRCGTDVRYIIDFYNGTLTQFTP
jgi:hypothetical protein